MFKSSVILERQDLDNKRIQQIRCERDEEVEKKLEVARRNMIQKEKYYQAIYDINRSPANKIMMFGKL